MARHATPLEDSPAWDIYQEFKKYSLTTQATPNPNAFYVNVMVPNGYALSRGGFDYWWLRLLIAGWISIDPVTRAVTIRDIELREKD